MCALLALVVAMPAAASDDPPRLLLLLTVDQGRGDYLERFRPVLEGGLKRLLDEGTVFAEMHHAHADTVTAAGHASLSTGRYPAHSGMVGNDWYDRVEGREVYCVEDTDALLLPPVGAEHMTAGRSPARLLTDAFPDWLQARSPASKVYSVGGKDRSAVLMGGKSADGVYWYDRNHGQWISSRHYMDAYPTWAREFQRRQPLDRYFGTAWTPLDVPTETLLAMEIESASFSRSFGRASLYRGHSFYDGLYNSPFIESYLFEYANRLVVEEKLGDDDVTDILALSFASIDTVGHSFGPNSREVLDTIMRLDRELGAFFAFLDARVGLERVAVSLSGDHGVASLPEHRAANGVDGGRFSTEDFLCFQAAGDAFHRKFGPDDWFVAELHFNSDTLARRDVDRAELERFLAREISRCPSIETVWTRTQIEQAAGASGNGWIDPTLQLYVNSFHPDRSADMFAQPKEGFMNRLRGTTHGSPYRYDTHVLTVVRWPGAEPKTVSARTHTVDLPVTLADLLGIPVPDDLDGVSRVNLIR